jgi:D-arabinonate dehydratase
MIIEHVRARTVRVPLDRPVETSDLVIDAREFVIVDVHATGGLVGRGFGFTRDGLVAATVERNLAPLLVGEDARLTERLWERMWRATRYLGRRGLLMRAISAVDIALWDLKAQAAGLPLWSLLGGYRERVPAYVAGGYYGPATHPDDVEAEFRGYRDAGYRGAKINVGGLPLAHDVERVAAARAGLGRGPGLAVDFNGALTSAREGVAWAEALAPYGIDFLEEPFLMDDLPALRTFRGQSPIAVAMGEDESGRWAFAELVRLEALDVVRHDATLVGGISEWTKVAGLALAHRLTLFPHWFPEIHVHLAAAYPGCRGVELIAPESGIMNLDRLIANPCTIVDGHVAAPTAPGLGIAWDADAVDRYTL